MPTRRFQTQVTAGHFTLPIAVFLSLFCWIIMALIAVPSDTSFGGSALFNTLLSGPFSSWAHALSSVLLYGVIGYLLIELNNVFAIIRMRASVQTSLYFLLLAVCPLVHRFYVGIPVTMSFLMALFFLFSSFRKTKASGDLFYSFACLGVGSILLPSLTWLLPVFWIGAFGFQSLRFKSFLASLLGWWLPYWFLLGHAYFYGEMELFYTPFRELIHFQPVRFDFLFWQAVTLGYLFLLFVVSAFHSLAAGYEDKIRTRSYLQFLVFLTFVLFIGILLQPSLCTPLLPTLLIGVSILAGHLFVLTNSRSSNIFFIAMLIGLCLLVGFNIWMC